MRRRERRASRAAWGTSWGEAAPILESARAEGRYAAEIEPDLSAREALLIEHMVAGRQPPGAPRSSTFKALIRKLRRWEAGGPFSKKLSRSAHERLVLRIRELMAGGLDLGALAAALGLTARQLEALRLYALSDRPRTMHQVAAELGVSFSAVGSCLCEVRMKLERGLEPAPRRSRRRAAEAREALSDEQILAMIASTGVTGAKKLLNRDKPLFQLAGKRGLLDQAFPVRVTPALARLRADLRRLPAHELERFIEALPELERDVVKHRVLADPPASARWFKTRTDGPRCTRLFELEKRLRSEVRRRLRAIDAAARAERREAERRAHPNVMYKWLATATDAEVEALVVAGGYSSRKQLQRARLTLFHAALDRGIVDRLFPENPTVLLGPLREAVRALPAEELERLMSELPELERDVVRYRALADPPATKRWFRTRTDGPQCEALAAAERRVASQILRQTAPDAVAHRILRQAIGPNPGGTPAKPKVRSCRDRVAALVRARLAERGCDLDALSRELQLDPRQRMLLETYVLPPERHSKSEVMALTGLHSSTVYAVTAEIEARLMGWHRRERSIPRHRSMTDAELEAAILASGARKRSELFDRLGPIARVATERGVIDRVMPKMPAVAVTRLRDAAARLRPDQQLALVADASPEARRVWQECVEQPSLPSCARSLTSLAKAMGLERPALEAIFKCFMRSAIVMRADSRRLAELQALAARLGPERVTALASQIYPRAAELLERRVDAAIPEPHTEIARQWGVSTKRVDQVELSLLRELRVADAELRRRGAGRGLDSSVAPRREP